MPIKIKKPGLLSKDISVFGLFESQFNAGSLSHFLFKMSFALDAGLTIPYALNKVRGLSEGRLSVAISQMEAGIDSGNAFSEELIKQKGFPVIISAMAEIGEKSGRVPEIFLKLSKYYEAEAKIKDEIRQAMIYPAAVSVAILAVIIVSTVFVLPGYARVFTASGAALPLPTRFLLGASVFISENLRAIFFIILALMISLYVFFGSKKGKYLSDIINIRLPIISRLTKKTVNMRFAYILGILSGAGVGVYESLGLIGRSLGNAAYGPVIDGVAEAVRNGVSLSDAIKDSDFFDPLMAAMISIGEETGRLPETVGKASAYLQLELSLLTGSMSKLIEPLITLALGLILAFVMLAVMLPSFSLTAII